MVVVGGGLVYLRGRSAKPATPVGEYVTFAAPLGLPPIPVPPDNPPTRETIELGKRLYYDTALSADDTVSCATCHHPDAGFADPKPVSIGVGGKTGTRNSPTVINAAYYTTQFWDGREPTLEKQAEGPVQNPVEMAHTLDSMVKKLSRDESYAKQFEAAFGPGSITADKVTKAIAAFERTVVAGNSPFDRWYYGGQKNAISESAKRGFDVFRRADKGNCAACHVFNENYALFTDQQFHNIGVGIRDEAPVDMGRYEVSKFDSERGAFKTPSLRNIDQTAPYMHDGSMRTLKEVVDHYVGGGSSNPWLDTKMKPVQLTAQEKADLIEFMKSLTGEVPASTKPGAAQR